MNAPAVTAVTSTELMAVLGADWNEIAAKPIELNGFFNLLSVTYTRQRGETPVHYTSVTTCERCGAVPIWVGCATKVKGCPWCFNRAAGLPIPNLETSSC